jgi:6-pyruvoyltetrahydropterin/6-carboxytetrahydropterin synthase
MKVAKRFRWEAAHRLPWHEGGCQHLHGHSYAMTVELEGEPDARGMLIDFKALKRIVKPLVDAWDHATLVAEDDAPLRAALEQLGSRHYVLPFDTTSENLCAFAADYLGQRGYALLKQHRVRTLRVRIGETETCYAEVERPVDAYATRTPKLAATSAA